MEYDTHLHDNHGEFIIHDRPMAMCPMRVSMDMSVHVLRIFITSGIFLVGVGDACRAFHVGFVFSSSSLKDSVTDILHNKGTEDSCHCDSSGCRFVTKLANAWVAQEELGMCEKLVIRGVSN